MNGLPRVVVLVAVALALIGLAFACALFVQPRAMLPALDHEQAAVRSLVSMLGNRSLSMALALVLALLLRSPQTLLAVLCMRALTELLDLRVIWSDGASAGLAVSGVMLLAELVAVWLLWRHLQKSRPVRSLGVAL